MKYSCDTIKDLLPLYHDNICSEASRAVVEEHLLECDSCKREMGKIDDDTYDVGLQRERDTVVERYSKKLKRTSVLAGLAIAGVMGIPILVCLIVNIATGNALDWFFIVLGSLMVVASVTVVPLIAETKRGLLTLASFTGSVLLLLAIICIYTRGNWFFIPAVSVLLGMSIIFLPYVLKQFPLRGFAAENRGLVSMAVNVVLLYFLLCIIGLYAERAGYWRISLQIATIVVLFAAGMFAVIRYLKANALTKAGICVIASGFFTVALQDAIQWILSGVWHVGLLDMDFLHWNNDAAINANIAWLTLVSCSVAGVILLLAGKRRKQSQRMEFDANP